MIQSGEKYLVTSDSWFYAPDGKKYKAAWGKVDIKSDSDTLGISTNRGSTNWYAIVGDEDHHVIIAGCQIHNAVRSEMPPDHNSVEDFLYNENGGKSFIRPSEIYIAEKIEEDKS